MKGLNEAAMKLAIINSYPKDIDVGFVEYSEEVEALYQWVVAGVKEDLPAGSVEFLKPVN